MARWREKNAGPGRRVLTDEERQASKERTRDRNREYMRQRRAADPEGHREKQRESNKKHGRKYWLKHQFGITPEAWDRMLIEQSGQCYLCERPMVTAIHIDHDHACCSGKRSCGKCIRGLACQKCNQGVGQFGDDPDLMERVARNLRAKMQ